MKILWKQSHIKQVESLRCGSQKSSQFKGERQDSRICTFRRTNTGDELQEARLMLQKHLSITWRSILVTYTVDTLQVLQYIQCVTLPKLPDSSKIYLIPGYLLWLCSALNQSSSFSKEVSSGGDCFGSASTRQTAGSKEKHSLSMISMSLDHQHKVSPNRTRLFNVVLCQIILQVA